MTIRRKRVVKSVSRQLPWAKEPILNLNQSMGRYEFDARAEVGESGFFLCHTFVTK